MLELRHRRVREFHRELHSFCKLLDKFERRIASENLAVSWISDAVLIIP